MNHAPGRASFTVEKSLRLRSPASGLTRLDSTSPVRTDIGEPGRVPRISSLLALAHRLQRLVDDGVVRDYSELARLGGVTTARMTQIMSLLLLAPEIQEEILFLPPVTVGRDPVHERKVGQLIRSADWGIQLRDWAALRAASSAGPPAAAPRFRRAARGGSAGAS